MPRRSLAQVGPHVWHAMNRAVQHGTLFSQPSDYTEFLSLLCDAAQQHPISLFAYCAMPNHWHLLVHAPTGSSLSSYLQWLAGVHGSLLRKSSHTTGRGAVYQGRFRAVPVEADQSFVRVCRYIERNPVRAGLVTRADEWSWSSAARVHGRARPPLAEWPIARPSRWTELLDSPQETAVVDLIRQSMIRGVPYGSKEWQEARFGGHVSVARSKGWREINQMRSA